MEVHDPQRRHVHPRAMTMATAHPTLAERVEAIRTREDFAAFVRDLLADLRAHPEHWENATLDRYLDALAAWVEDMDSWARNNDQAVPVQPGWKQIGQALLAASLYE